MYCFEDCSLAEILGDWAWVLLQWSFSLGLFSIVLGITFLVLNNLKIITVTLNNDIDGLFDRVKKLEKKLNS